MRSRALRSIAATAVAGAAATLAQAAPSSLVIGFDDIDASLGDVPLSSPYQGLAWTNVAAYTDTPGFAGFNAGIVSGPNAAYSGGETFGQNGVEPLIGGIAVSPATSAFDVLSASVGAGYYTGLAVTFQGFKGADLLFTKTVIAEPTGPLTVTFDFRGIDRLTFFAAATAASTDPFACGVFNCTQFTLDALRVVTYPAVPEPDTAALLLAGLGALAAGARNRERRRRA